MLKSAEPGGTAFLVFSDDWGEHPSSCQHLFRHIAREHTTVWVNTVGMRTPGLNAADARKALKKVRKMLGRSGSGQGSWAVGRHLRLSVCQPPMLPLQRVGLVRRLNRASVVRTVRKAMHEVGVSEPVLVTTVPNACDYIGAFGERQVVYYCVDDFTEWPGLERDLVREMEEDLVRKADVFVATSEKLFQRLRATGKPSHLLTHGVDVEHFSRLPAEEHPVLAAIPKPRVGYYGLFDERFDRELLAGVAQRLPDVSFVITGRVEADKGALADLPNVHFTGPVPYRELPAVLAGWDACMLPYVRSQLTEAINPLKLKEYIASGLPVVSTPLPEALRFNGLLRAADGASGWIEALETLLREGRRRPPHAVQTVLAGESWGEKAEHFVSLCLLSQGAPVEG